MDTLQQEIEFWNGYGVEVEWFANAGRTEAIGIGEGFAWSILIDRDGVAHTNEAALGEWSTGIEI